MIGTAGPRPSKGSGLIERKARRASTVNHELAEKRAVRKRDGHRCRWPYCEYKALRPRLEVAHLNDKGMGGDHGIRSTRDQMIYLCLLHHQGAKSLHTGDLEIRPLTTDGTNGPCVFIDHRLMRSIAEIAVCRPEPQTHD